MEHEDYTIAHHHSRCLYHQSINTIYGCYGPKTGISGLGPSRRIYKDPRLNGNRGHWGKFVAKHVTAQRPTEESNPGRKLKTDLYCTDSKCGFCGHQNQLQAD